MKNFKNRMIIFLFVALFSAFVNDYGLKAQSNSRPNIIYILADDLGYGDLSCYGQEKLETPNIDRIAEEGILFTDHYSGNTVCSPSRAVLMTGQHPGHVHCRTNSGPERIALDPDMVTLPRLFKNAGYATGAFGKWGLGTTSESGPQNPLLHGFDEFSGWKNQVIAHTYYPSSIIRNGREIPLEPGTYIHDLIMDDAFAFIERNIKADKAFFCYIPTAIPHAAMHAPENLHNKWRKKYPWFNMITGTYYAGKDEICPDVINPVAGYAAMMEHFDNQIGKLFQMLEKYDVNDQTLIMFSSDNGPHMEGGHNPWFWDSNGPFRGHKRDFYEGGIRVPFIARWPGVIPAGSQSNHISAFWDVLPTMAEIIDQAVPPQTDGISFLSALKGEDEHQKKHDYLYWEASEKEPYAIAVRRGHWKAVINGYRSEAWKPDFQLAPLELYNLKYDIGEEKNVAEEFPFIVEKMKNIMNEAHEPLIYK